MKVPLIPSAAVSEFGDLRESPAFRDSAVMDQDMSYVPGFSEMRRTHEIQKAEYLRGERSWGDVLKLPVNLRWMRSQDKSGNPDSRKVFQHGSKGYRPVNGHSVKDGGDAGTPWLTQLPPGAVLQADGSIRRGDTTLGVCTADEAAKSEIAKRQRTDALIGASESIFAKNLGAVGMKGVDPESVRLSQDEKLFQGKKK